eukprot:TRINITY_DN9977_c0_g1_i1.p1 TRINITY_DN9977_c0_g1~~TRINITY_DN9977_c0_g1_i1.p1  ORF type:complete len:663 (+),score=104.09 TRINITY_DN9977_c0_g1_i1:66-1991(+)
MYPVMEDAMTVYHAIGMGHMSAILSLFVALALSVRKTKAKKLDEKDEEGPGDRNNNLHALYTIAPKSFEIHTQPGTTRVTSEAFMASNGEVFSKMKYGYPVNLHLYASQLETMIRSTFGGLEDKPDDYLLIVPGAIKLPTAATHLAHRLVQLLQIPAGRMARAGHISKDFAKITSAKERAKAMKGAFRYEGPKIADSTKVILIEDTVVSGAHYIETQRALTLETGVPLKNIHCFVVASLEGLENGVEGALNEVYFDPEDSDITDKVMDSLDAVPCGTDPTSRQVKFTLKLPASAFSQFLEWFKARPAKWQQWLLAAITKDGLDAKFPEPYLRLLDASKASQRAVGRRNNNLHALYTIAPEGFEIHTQPGTERVTPEVFMKSQGEVFSKMKYGYPANLDLYAEQLEARIRAMFNDLNERPFEYLLLIPGAIVLPTAATHLANRLVQLLGVPAGRMVRAGHISKDFAKITSAEERAQAMKGAFKYEGPAIAESTKVIIIEDTVVSGAHYIETQRALTSETGVPLKNIHCFIVASLEGLDNSVEGALNEVYFNPEDSAITDKVMDSLEAVPDGADPTSRQIKFILKLPFKAFGHFLERFEARPAQWQQWLLAAITKDGLDRKLPGPFSQLLEASTAGQYSAGGA